MAWWSRLTGGTGGRTGGHGAETKQERGAAAAHLEEFVRTRPEVEAFVEPATTITPTTLLLVAKDGEWTRRPVPDQRTAYGFAERVGIPAYDITRSGYPSAMREWNARNREPRDDAGYV